MSCKGIRVIHHFFIEDHLYKKLFSAPLRLGDQIMKLNKQLIEMSEFKVGSLLLSFMDSSTDIIFIKDLNSIYVAANREFQRLLGLSQSEIVGKSDYDLFEKSMAEKFIELDQQLFIDQVYKPLEEWVTYPDGRRVFYDIIKTPLFNDEGLLIGIIGMGRNISERKLFEGILKEREQSLNELLEGMNQGLGIHEIILNADQEPIDFRFLEINKNYELITGLTKKQVIGKRVLEVLPETESYWIQIYGEVAKTGKSIKFENYSKELGKTFEVYAFRPKEGQFAVLVNDISEKKQYE